MNCTMKTESNNRTKLKNFLCGGDLRSHQQRVFIVCNGKETLESVEDIESDIDIDLYVHCTDRSQLELQRNPHKAKHLLN